MEEKTYTIQQLSELTDFPRRTIRYYIQEGILAPPAGRGRGGFYYDSHLYTLSKIKTLQEQGMNLSAIIRVLKQDKPTSISVSGETWTRCRITNKLEFHVRNDTDNLNQREISKITDFIQSIINDRREI